VPQNNVEFDPAVTNQVLSYFLRNRQATDTLEGIARWRLLEEQVNRSVRQTEAALDWLVEQGFLEEVETPGAQASLFRLSPGKLEEAKAFLAGSDEKKHRKSGMKKSR
jgi:hypothetical protein